MILGLYGGIANNCYVFAQSFAQAGVGVRFIRDRADPYAFSQPVWEDCRFTLAYSEVVRSGSLPWTWWQQKEAEVGWRPPGWLRDPEELGLRHRPPTSSWRSPWTARYLRTQPFRHGVVEAMRSCDALIVCGADATILASIAGKPFGIWPHGGDIRLAAGLHPAPIGLRAKVSHVGTLKLIRKAYEQSAWVGTHDPKGVGGDVGDVSRVLAKVSFQHVPIPIMLRKRSAQVERRAKLLALLGELGHAPPTREQVGFVPSRVDFKWKGQDRFLQALAQLPDRVRPHLIFSGWGNDLPEAKQFVHEKGLDQCVTFLNVALSKPFLFEMFSSCDFAVDQFYFGTYGTAMVEAMGCGLPVMMWIEEAAFQVRAWEAPPVVNCRQVPDIVEALTRIANRSLDLEKAGCLAQDWVKRVHGPEVVLPRVLSLFAN